MIEVLYSKTFIKKFAKLTPDLQEEVADKVDQFKDTVNHPKLKVHKLQKPFVGVYAFSVNYKVRILFEYTQKNKQATLLLTIGNHDIYKR